jgi:hypothetical protein
MNTEQIDQLLRDAYKRIDQNAEQLKDEIAQMVSKAVDKQKFEKGKWYKLKSHPNCIARYNNYGHDGNYGIDWDGKWSNIVTMQDPNLWTEATHAEVEVALIKEAERRGFEKGAKYYGVEGIDKLNLITVDEICTAGIPDGLFCENSWIVYKGQWAEIVEEGKEKFVNTYEILGDEEISGRIYNSLERAKKYSYANNYICTYKLVKVNEGE